MSIPISGFGHFSHLSNLLNSRHSNSYPTCPLSQEKRTEKLHLPQPLRLPPFMLALVSVIGSCLLHPPWAPSGSLGLVHQLSRYQLTGGSLAVLSVLHTPPLSPPPCIPMSCRTAQSAPALLCSSHGDPRTTKWGLSPQGSRAPTPTPSPSPPPPYLAARGGVAPVGPAAANLLSPRPP